MLFRSGRNYCNTSHQARSERKHQSAPQPRAVAIKHWAPLGPWNFETAGRQQCQQTQNQNIEEQHQSQKEALAAAQCGLRARVLLWQVTQFAPTVNFTDCAVEINEMLRILMVQVYPSKASRASLLV